MNSSDSDLSVPKNGEELIYIQQRLESEIVDLFAEYNRLYNLIDLTGPLCDINDAAWVIEEQSSLIDKLIRISIPKTEMPPTKPEQFLTLLHRVKQDNQLQLAAKEVIKDQIENIETKLNDASAILQVQKDNLKAFKVKDRTQIDLKEWNSQTKKDFQTYRRYLHKILESHFQQIDLKNLVQSLTAAYFKGKDEYIDISKKYSFADVEILKQALLISQHPIDPTKIKFCNMA